MAYILYEWTAVRPCDLFHKRSALDGLLDQRPSGCELHFHFDPLEAFVISHDDFAAEVDVLIAFEVQAEVVIQVDAAFDDLAAATALDLEDVISFFRFGGITAEEFFEEAHCLPF